MKPWLALLGILFGCLSLSPGAAAQEEARVVVAVADSTCDAIQEAGKLFAAGRNLRMEYICKSSGRLAKGIIGGAISADFYVSASQDWMDEMIAAGRIDRAQSRGLWSNGLVVAVPRESPLRLAALEELAGPAPRRLLIGDPGTAPFGRYTKQALEKAGLWDRVLPLVATRKNISLVADALAESDGATAGILFATHLDERLRVLMTVPGDLHDPIRYFSAPLKAARDSPSAIAFGAFLETAEATEVFLKAGFRIAP